MAARKSHKGSAIGLRYISEISLRGRNTTLLFSTDVWTFDSVIYMRTGRVAGFKMLGRDRPKKPNLIWESTAASWSGNSAIGVGKKVCNGLNPCVKG